MERDRGLTMNGLFKIKPESRSGGKLMKRVLCYGDSNTYGHDPKDGSRLPYGQRWPGILSGLLGPDWQVIEEGLCGRTISHEDAAIAGRNGMTYLEPCMRSQFPLDYMIVMLGTNDLQSVYSAIPQTVAMAMETMLQQARRVIASENQKTKIILVSPIHIGDTGVHDVFRDLFPVGHSDRYSERLAPLYRDIADRCGCLFLDAAEAAKPSPVDGLHMDAENHEKLAKALYRMLE